MVRYRTRICTNTDIFLLFALEWAVIVTFRFFAGLLLPSLSPSLSGTFFSQANQRGSRSSWNREWLISIKILIADDSDALRRSLRDAIEITPEWQVCGEAINGAEAIEMAKQLNPDLVILDLAMPVMNGLDAAERLSQEMPHVPLLLWTFYATKVLAPHAKKAGISGLLSKSSGLDGNLTAAIRALAAGQQFFPVSLTEED